MTSRYSSLLPAFTRYCSGRYQRDVRSSYSCYRLETVRAVKTIRAANRSLRDWFCEGVISYLATGRVERALNSDVRSAVMRCRFVVWQVRPYLSKSGLRQVTESRFSGEGLLSQGRRGVQVSAPIPAFTRAAVPSPESHRHRGGLHRNHTLHRGARASRTTLGLFPGYASPTLGCQEPRDG